MNYLANNPHIEPHVTEDELDAYLIGDSSTGVEVHLSSCELCSVRLGSALAPIAGFSAASLAWGERRSATMPMQRFMSRELTWNQRLAWTASMAAAVAVGFAVPMATNQARMERDQTLAASTNVASVARPGGQSDPRLDDRIASDNQMLQAIDDQFDVASDAPAALGLVSVAKNRSITPSSLQD